jgi:hypothetical protein
MHSGPGPFPQLPDLLTVLSQVGLGQASEPPLQAQRNQPWIRKLPPPVLQPGYCSALQDLLLSPGTSLEFEHRKMPQ